MDRHFVPGLFHDFALGSVARMLARHELALGQHPGLFPSHPHDGDAWS